MAKIRKPFADLYMKSGLYIAEIVKRLYRSERMKSLHPDDRERLRHIFSKQVYGLAPTEIIYRIALSFLFGFEDSTSPFDHNIRLCDSLEYVKNGMLDSELKELFGFEQASQDPSVSNSNSKVNPRPT